jgi:hypothetical protein
LAGTKKNRSQFHQFDMKISFVDGLGGVWWGSVVVRSFAELWKRARVRQYISDMLRGRTASIKECFVRIRQDSERWKEGYGWCVWGGFEAQRDVSMIIWIYITLSLWHICSVRFAGLNPVPIYSSRDEADVLNSNKKFGRDN